MELDFCIVPTAEQEWTVNNMRLKDVLFTACTGGLYLIWKQILED